MYIAHVTRETHMHHWYFHIHLHQDKTNMEVLVGVIFLILHNIHAMP